MASSKSRSRNGARSGGAARSGARTATAAPLAKATPTTAAKPVRQPAPARAAERKTETAQTAVPAAVAVTEEPERPSGPSLWLQLTSFALAILGLGVSAYETYAHFNGSHLAGCSASPTSTFNCTAVITSSQSMVFGLVPVAVLGLLFYVFVVAIMSPWAWRWRRREVGLLRLVSMVAGMGFVMYLIYAELYQIGDICEYCTGVHIITFLLFCLTLVATAFWGVGNPKTADLPR
jgi:uncharacterized membrane protein